MTALPALSAPLSTAVALLMVTVVVALVAWALQLMQAANDRQEFSLMLAGCMVCSAAVGLATVMVLTLTGPERLAGAPLPRGRAADRGLEAGISLNRVVLPESVSLPDSLVLPWDGQF